MSCSRDWRGFPTARKRRKAKLVLGRIRFLTGRRSAEDHGKTGRSVEQTIDDYPNVQICADLANRLKHLKLERSRTGLFPYLGKLRRSIPQEAINSITFRAFEVETEVADPNLVTVTLPVFDQNGNELGDAFEYARKAITDLEKIRETIEK